MSSLVLDNIAIYTPTVAGTRWIPTGHIVVSDGTIVSVDEGRWPGEAEGVELIEGAQAVAVPGFVNTHTHSNLGLYQGIWDIRRFAHKPARNPLQQAGAPPYTEFMTPDEHRLANYLTMIGAIKSGTTTL